MSGGLLTAAHTLELEKGWSLELLSAWEALEARREAEQLARDDQETGLCANACLLARALRREGKTAFAGGREVLEALTAGQIAELAGRWAEFDRQVNPSALDGEERLEPLKKD